MKCFCNNNLKTADIVIAFSPCGRRPTVPTERSDGDLKKTASIVIPTERSDEGSLKQQRKRRFFVAPGMTKQRFVIGEFISVTTNEPMLFCFVIGEFISVTMNEPMLFCFVIGEYISVTMNEPMLFCFVIDEFCSNRSNVALPPLRQ